MASYIYSIRIKSNTPLVEEDLDDAFDGLFSANPDVNVQVTEFDLEDEEYSQV